MLHALVTIVTSGCVGTVVPSTSRRRRHCCVRRITIVVGVVVAQIVSRCRCLWWWHDKVRGRHEDGCTRAGGQVREMVRP
jgi:hypothetical protein